MVRVWYVCALPRVRYVCPFVSTNVSSVHVGARYAAGCEFRAFCACTAYVSVCNTHSEDGVVFIRAHAWAVCAQIVKGA